MKKMKKQFYIDEILEKLGEKVNIFSFVLRNDFVLTQQTSLLLNELSIYLIKSASIREWPGTILIWGQATIFVYKLNLQSMRIIIKYSNELFKWVHPMLPEDITFYSNDIPIFVSITHEKIAYYCNH